MPLNFHRHGTVDVARTNGAEGDGEGAAYTHVSFVATNVSSLDVHVTSIALYNMTDAVYISYTLYV